MLKRRCLLAAAVCTFLITCGQSKAAVIEPTTDHATLIYYPYFGGAPVTVTGANGASVPYTVLNETTSSGRPLNNGAVEGSIGTNGSQFVKLYGFATSDSPTNLGHIEAVWHDTLRVKTEDNQPGRTVRLVFDTGGNFFGSINSLSFSVGAAQFLAGVDAPGFTDSPNNFFAALGLGQNTNGLFVKTQSSGPWLSKNFSDTTPGSSLFTEFDGKFFIDVPVVAQPVSSPMGGNDPITYSEYSTGDWSLRVRLRANAANSDFYGDFAHTIEFAGAYEVSGQPIPDATFTSGLTAVPEPGSFVIAATGVCAFFCGRVLSKRGRVQ